MEYSMFADLAEHAGARPARCCAVQITVHIICTTAVHVKFNSCRSGGACRRRACPNVKYAIYLVPAVHGMFNGCRSGRACKRRACP